MPKKNTLDDKLIIATLLLIPISIIVSVVTWDPHAPAVALTTPVIAAALAIFTALDQRKARNVTWFVLAMQLAVLVIAYLTTPTP
jgi:hypothetical protein